MLGIPFPFCGFFITLFFATLHNLVWSHPLHPERQKLSAPKLTWEKWRITCKQITSETKSKKNREEDTFAYLVSYLEEEPLLVTGEALPEEPGCHGGGLLQKLSMKNKRFSCCESPGSQRTPRPLHNHRMLDSSSRTPSPLQTTSKGNGYLQQTSLQRTMMLPTRPAANTGHDSCAFANFSCPTGSQGKSAHLKVVLTADFQR